MFLSTVYSQQLLLVKTEVAIEKGLHLMPGKGVAKNLIENDYDRGQCNLHLCTFEQSITYHNLHSFLYNLNLSFAASSTINTDTEKNSFGSVQHHIIMQHDMKAIYGGSHLKIKVKLTTLTDNAC